MTGQRRRDPRGWPWRRRSPATGTWTASAVAEATALFIAGSGAAGYATRRDLTATARPSFWAGRTAVTDQCSGQCGSPARSHGLGGDRGWELNVSPRSYLLEVPCECHR